MYRIFAVALIATFLCAGARAEQQPPQKYVVQSGTRIPLVLVNSVSTKNAREGDRVYLQTAFPIAVNGRIVIPQGSYVTGTITQTKRPGRVKGRGELYVRFDTLMLPNGVQRDFRAIVSSVDGDIDAKMKSDEGKIEGDATKGKDVGGVAETGASGATVGAIAGGGKGAAIGGGIGAATGLGAVLLTRGADLKLSRGTSVEMQLDRELTFTAEEVNFLGTAPPPSLPPAPAVQQNEPSRGVWPGRMPLPRL
ncbi:MAG: hypothetical protein HYX72_04340 [Acidobacteria bacterium]|nr:hypothetical protein [Acidobacteriota bacterium]